LRMRLRKMFGGSRSLAEQGGFAAFDVLVRVVEESHPGGVRV
jgi:hypothetical protein